jgi:hypothetical protein
MELGANSVDSFCFPVLRTCCVRSCTKQWLRCRWLLTFGDGFAVFSFTKLRGMSRALNVMKCSPPFTSALERWSSSGNGLGDLAERFTPLEFTRNSGCFSLITDGDRLRFGEHALVTNFPAFPPPPYPYLSISPPRQSPSAGMSICNRRTLPLAAG